MPIKTNLDDITDLPGLLSYLRDELDWPVDADSFDDATFDYSLEELGLKEDVVGGGIEIKQLRPLTDYQPWGIFFLNLPHKRLPQTIVRNILGRLTVKKRTSANKSDRVAFARSDLMFIAATGAVAERRLAFAYFTDGADTGDASTFRILGWDANDTPRRRALTEASLDTKLRWPDDPADTSAWRNQWSHAFIHADTRTVIRDSKAMAKALAALARRIRDRAAELVAAQTDTGSLVKLHKAFKEALIHDLTPAGFADTYAQTIAYGLLSTAISRQSGALVQEDMTANVAGTSPFLKEMLGTFIAAGGRRPGCANAGLDFDELGVTEIVDLLRTADMEAVLADFDRKNPDEDPVIHFYELFLKEYDAEQKVKRGVFYTPRPVVSFIVRLVDELLRTEFGLSDGLASTVTWGEMIATKPGIALPPGAKADDFFVRILDPATGTGTFLVECVDLIHRTMMAKWQAEGHSLARLRALWNDYVPNHLLPRLTGFELMMAPYAIAHVKLGLKLSDTGYRFRGNAHAQIYLTNALEPSQNRQLNLELGALAHEAQAANKAKDMQFTVVLGNPPYAGVSNNRQPWIESLIKSYRFVDGKPLNESKVWLLDDYVKFIRMAQYRVTATGAGIVCLVTNNSYLEGITHRGMRQSLIQSFGQLRFLDLCGDAKLPLPVASLRDENVFDIMQGVSICTMSVFLEKDCAAKVRIKSLVGDRASKFETLKNGLTFGSETSIPSPPNYFFRPRVNERSEYITFQPLKEIMPLGGLGFQSHRDAFVVDIDLSALEKRMTKFFDPGVSDQQVESLFEISSYRSFQINSFRKKNKFKKASLLRFQSRPFDYRYIYYAADIVQEWQIKTHGPLLMPNVGLNTVRQTKAVSWQHAMVSSTPTPAVFIEIKDGSSQFPLWLRPQGTETRTLPNIAPGFARRVASLTMLSYDDGTTEPKQASLPSLLPAKPQQIALLTLARRERGEPGKSFGPRDLFDYIYAILHSPTYRSRYADYLKSDFARIPLPASAALFEALVPLGRNLVALHLLDSAGAPVLADPAIRLAGNGEARVAQLPTFDAALGRVHINPTRWFETVPETAWTFYVGGYQPAQKWLKDRAAKGGKKPSLGHVLNNDDILHYRRMIVALTCTAELMPKIDAIIGVQGGWPDAFRGMTNAPAAEAAD